MKGLPKGARADYLRMLRSTNGYNEARNRHLFDSVSTVNTTRLQTVVERATTIEDLEDKLSSQDILIQNEHKGFDHAEHLLKRLEMAEALGRPDFIPNVGRLREKYSEFIEGEDITSSSETISHEDISDQKFEQFLKKKTSRPYIYRCGVVSYPC